MQRNSRTSYSRILQKCLITCIVASAGAAVVLGDVFDLSWNTIDGGGYMFSTGGDFSLGGTIGQPDASVTVMTGGDYSLAGGFWIQPACGTADFDCDGDVDLVDFVTFTHCFNGPNKPPAEAGCEGADFDADEDVDLADFTTFTHCFNGPNNPPACG